MRLPLSIGLLLWLTALFGQQTHKTLPVFRELDSLTSACKYRETHTLIQRTLRNNPHLDKVDKANLYLRLSELHGCAQPLPNEKAPVGTYTISMAKTFNPSIIALVTLVNPLAPKFHLMLTSLRVNVPLPSALG